MADIDKQQWQAEQEALSAAMDKQREKERKTRERSARNAQRKLERLRRTLSEAGELSDWEDEFSDSVVERLDQYGSAFHDLEKGRPGDALSFAQKRVVAALNKKAKDQRKAKQAERAAARGDTANSDNKEPDEKEPPHYKPRSSFKPKRKNSFKPRVRQIDEDFDNEDFHDEKAGPPAVQNAAPFIPAFTDKPKAQKPFLRIVKTDS